MNKYNIEPDTTSVGTWVTPTSVDELKSKRNEIFLSIVAICSNADTANLEHFISHLPKRKDIELIILRNTIISGQMSDVGPHAVKTTDNMKLYNMSCGELDFSKLRNKAKSQARGQWILSLDIDEIIPNFFYEGLLEQLKELPIETKGLKVGIVSNGWEQIEGDLPRYAHEQVKIFRNEKQIEYQGSIHEMVEWTIPKENIAISNIIIYHMGYSESREILIDKLFRNIRLLSKEVWLQKDEERFKFYFTYLQATMETYRELTN